jgi:cytochrome b561
MFGIPIPQILSGPGPDRLYHNLSEEAHMVLSYLLAALIVVHIAGSLRHHFIKRNDVMRRMWFGTRATRPSEAGQPATADSHPPTAIGAGR